MMASQRGPAGANEASQRALLSHAAIENHRHVIDAVYTATQCQAGCQRLSETLSKQNVKLILERLCTLVERPVAGNDWIDDLDEFQALLARAQSLVESCQREVDTWAPGDPRESDTRSQLMETEEAIRAFATRDFAARLKQAIEQLEALDDGQQDALMRARQLVTASEPGGHSGTPRRLTGGLPLSERTQTSVAIAGTQGAQRPRLHCVPDEVRKEVLQHADTLVPELTDKLDTCPLIGIVGMPGIGKRTLAKAVAQMATKAHVCSTTVVLDVGEHRDERDVLQQAWQQLLPNDPVPAERAESVAHELAQKLHGKSLLVVFVNVCSHHTLPVLNFAQLYGHKEHQKQNRVIVTTSDASVLNADQTGEKWYIQDMPKLDEEHARCLLCRSAFSGRDPPAEYDDVVRDVLRTARGLPLMVKLLGADLSGQSVATWRQRLEQLGSADVRSRGMCQLRQLVQPSIQALPPLLRRCFAVFGAFPQDSVLPRSQLLHIFRGICPFRPAAEWERAQLQRLQDRRLVHHVEDWLKGEGFSMHGALWDVASTLARGAIATYYFSRVHKTPTAHEPPHSSPKQPRSENVHKSARIIVLDSLSEAPEGVCLVAPNAQVLVHLGAGTSVPQPLPAFAQLPRLQHLHLAAFAFETLPVGLEGLLLLQSLVVNDCEQLLELPPSVGCLRSLVLLDLQRCGQLVGLPESLGRLSRLGHLDLQWCGSLGGLPESIGELTQLSQLNLRGCRSLGRLPHTIAQLPQLSPVNAKLFKDLTRAHESTGQLPPLELPWFDVDEVAHFISLPPTAPQAQNAAGGEVGACLVCQRQRPLLPARLVCRDCASCPE